jgi:hypothetical protein
MPDCLEGFEPACYQVDGKDKIKVKVSGKTFDFVKHGSNWVPEGTPSSKMLTRLANTFLKPKAEPAARANAPANLTNPNETNLEDEGEGDGEVPVQDNGQAEVPSPPEDEAVVKTADAEAVAAAEAAVDAVENAVNAKSDVNVVHPLIIEAETAINALITGDKKTNLQVRLSNLMTKQTILNILNRAKAAVDAVEEAGDEEKGVLITAAQSAINQLPYGDEKTKLLDRLSNLTSGKGGARRKRRSNKRKPKKSAKKPKRSKKGKTRKQKK